MNIKWVTPRLAVSGRQPKSAEHLLQGAGITGILNLTIKPDPKWSIQTLDDGEPDDGQPKPPQWFTRGIHFADAVMAHGKILIHCEAGVNRSPSMAYAVLRSQGMSQGEATNKIFDTCNIRQVRYAADAERALGNG